MIDDDERASVAITVANPAAPRRTGLPGRAPRPSCWHRHERHQSPEVEGSARKAKEPVHLRESPQLHFPDPGDRLEPPKRGLNPGPRMQTLRVAVVPGRARVDGAAAAALQVLRHVGCDVEGRARMARSGWSFGIGPIKYLVS